jgi:hypothetical protein
VSRKKFESLESLLNEKAVGEVMSIALEAVEKEAGEANEKAIGEMGEDVKKVPQPS